MSKINYWEKFESNVNYHLYNRWINGTNIFLEKRNYQYFLENQFKRLFSSYALAFNKQNGRTGSLFQKRFKRISMKNEYKLWNTLIYIHHNPIHHKFTKSYEQWEYSSYSTYLSNLPTLVERKKVLSWFENDSSKKIAAFIGYHERFKMDQKMDFLE